ncbi:hypothetical protein Pan189_04750 [Stratiformator vulcanicus]|uniref:FERM domain-containing protein n=1 Tax=Stratiformator vulcanicus TaxID=2527980 RepID=A0A517QX21_9PLAN|nr:hypothetical protein Pan189_04750 [Stratiformator vulcanicus]
MRSSWQSMGGEVKINAAQFGLKFFKILSDLEFFG